MRPLLAGMAAACTLMMAGCGGFTPLYGQTAAGSSLTRISVSTQDDRLGYRLREQLEDALGRDASQPALWRLETAVEQSRRPLGRRLDDTAVRYELTVRAAWTLTPVNGGNPVTGTETAVVTYASTDQPYAAISAQQDGEERAAAELARGIRLDLLTSLSGQ